MKDEAKARSAPQIQNYIDLANAIMTAAIEDYGHGFEMYQKGKRIIEEQTYGKRSVAVGKVLFTRATRNIRECEIFLRSGYFAILCRGEYDGDDIITYMRKRYGYTEHDDEILYEVGKCNE